MATFGSQSSQSLISEPVYIGIVSTLFTLAITIFILRMIIRFYKMQKLHIDDYFLILAIASLTTSFGLFMAGVPYLFLFNAVLAGQAPLPFNIIQLASDTALWFAVGETLAWTTIFAVKFSFLFVFRTLVRRIRPLEILWWVTFALCTPIAIISICGTWIVCPDSGAALLTYCVTAPSFLRSEMIMFYYDIVADVVTDFLIVSIPVALLWRTRLSVRQKLSIGVVLCLSLVMICINIVRGIYAGIHGTSDQIWTTFWVQIECAVATIMVSLSAFRQLFLASTSSQSGRRGQRGWRRFSPTSASPRRGQGILGYGRLLSRKSPGRSNESALPRVEVGATMTGMRTMIRECEPTATASSGRESAQGEVAAEAAGTASYVYYR